MNPEERIDLNDRRLNDHATRIARLEENIESISDDISCLRKETKGGFADIKAEIRTYFGPISKKLTDQAATVVSLEKDMGWIKPWFKRLTIGTATIAGIGLGVEYLLQYVKP